MDPISEGVGFLVKLIPVAWEQVQKQLALAKSAEREFDILKMFNADIEHLLNEAYSKEVINKPSELDIKQIWRSLRKSEDAIEDLQRRELSGDSSLRHFFSDRAFVVDSRDIRNRWKEYAADPRFAPTGISNGSTSNHAQSSTAGHRPSSSIDFSEDHEWVGSRVPVDQLFGMLTEQLPTENPIKSKAIFVHGVQGVGKTSLVAAVLGHRDMKNFFKCCVWVDDLRSYELADDPAVELMKANATMWDLTMGEMNNHGSPVELGKAFELMKEKTANNFGWALVLDDAGGANVFKFLRAHLIETRPSMLVTTEVRSLSSTDYLKAARYVSSDFEVVFLSKNDSRSLFDQQMKGSFGDLLSECEKSPSLKDASNLILRRCKGLPLTILATCKLLKCKKVSDVSGDSPAVQWEKLSGRLEEELLSGGHLVDPNGRKITLHINHLLDVRNVLFYLSIFPLDLPIKCSTMMQLWMAEGFIKQEDSQPVRAKAENILSKLLDNNIIREKKTSYGRVKIGRIHNLLHQIIISKSKDGEFAMIVAHPHQKLPKDVRYLSFHSPMGKIDHGTSVERLRSLHVFKEVYEKYLDKLLEKVERLKVLHIRRHLTKEEKLRPPASLATFPRKILRSKYLRYLSLRGTDIKRIPEGIKDLAYLESLDLRDTLLHELPNGILELANLCHLLVSRSKRSRTANTDPNRGVGSNKSHAADTDPVLGVQAPSELGRLTLLQKLCMIELKPVKGAKKGEREQLLEELGKLTDLQRLGLSMLETTDAEHLCSSIEKLTNLEALRLIAAPEQKIDLSKKELGPALKRLQRVHLTGGLQTLPEWILHYDGLVKLVLKRSQLPEDALQRLGELRYLKHLELEQAFDVTDMTIEAGKFQGLCFLGLDRFDGLESIKVDTGALPNLERLSLARCNSLSEVPPFIISHEKLKCLQFWDMPEEFDRAIKVLIKKLRERMKVKLKKWKDPVVEEVESLPVKGKGKGKGKGKDKGKGKGSPSAPPPCVK